MNKESYAKRISAMTLEEIIEYSDKHPEESLEIVKILTNISHKVFSPVLLLR